MPAMITMRCPTCRARIKAPTQLLGQRRDCPGCGTKFLVRIQPVQDSDPLLVTTERRASDSR